jgi:hypothetical protein
MMTMKMIETRGLRKSFGYSMRVQYPYAAISGSAPV